MHPINKEQHHRRVIKFFSRFYRAFVQHRLFLRWKEFLHDFLYDCKASTEDEKKIFVSREGVRESSLEK